jgi:hypothetical protein
MDEEMLARVRAVKSAYEHELLQKRNVVGVGIGLRTRNAQPTNELAIVVSVTNKVPAEALDSQDLIPHELEGVPVDVQAIGFPIALGE